MTATSFYGKNTTPLPILPTMDFKAGKPPLVPGGPYTDPIIHRKLTLIPTSPPAKGVKFIAVPIPPTMTDIVRYAEQIRQNPSPLPKASKLKSMTRALPSPYDIIVTHQCHVLLELDDEINWEFSVGSYGVSTDGSHGSNRYGENFGAVFVESSLPDRPTMGATVQNRKCRLLYFSVAQRRPNETMHKFNFHIDFYQTVKEQDENGVEIHVEKFLPMIFDPDVGNNGGAIFPP